MKADNLETPVVYCSPGAVRLYRDEALKAGAVKVTASPVELFEPLSMPVISKKNP
jgi:hypothetical protein